MGEVKVMMLFRELQIETIFQFPCKCMTDECVHNIFNIAFMCVCFYTTFYLVHSCVHFLHVLNVCVPFKGKAGKLWHSACVVENMLSYLTFKLSR